jgi:hypothetical protein
MSNSKLREPWPSSPLPQPWLLTTEAPAKVGASLIGVPTQARRARRYPTAPRTRRRIATIGVSPRVRGAHCSAPLTPYLWLGAALEPPLRGSPALRPLGNAPARGFSFPAFFVVWLERVLAGGGGDPGREVGEHGDWGGAELAAGAVLPRQSRSRIAPVLRDGADHLDGTPTQGQDQSGRETAT